MNTRFLYPDTVLCTEQVLSLLFFSLALSFICKSNRMKISSSYFNVPARGLSSNLTTSVTRLRMLFIRHIFHLVSYFKLFDYTLTLCHLFYHLFVHILCLSANVRRNMWAIHWIFSVKFRLVLNISHCFLEVWFLYIFGVDKYFRLNNFYC